MNEEANEQLAIAAARRQRLQEYMQEQKLDGILISRRDNFAWLTCGGANNVLRQTENGSAYLLLTPKEQYLLAYRMDCGRILEEQITGQGYEPVVNKWHEGDPALHFARLVHGALASDTPFQGARFVELARMHGPLAPLEMERCRWLGEQTAAVFEELVLEIHPGLAEETIAHMLSAKLTLRGMETEVLITGSDDRIGRYWHAVPSGKTVERFALIHGAAGKWGLHACVNRLVCFGEPPEQIRRAHHAAKTIQARVLGMLSPGVKYADILKNQKQWYKELGYADDWELHFQGGPMGYYLGDPLRCETDMRIENNQAFDWFITVRGVQTEELTLLTDRGVEVASIGKTWPRANITVDSNIVTVPDIYIA